MSQINLLPWREESREQQKKEYLTKLSFVGLLAVLLVFIWITFASTELANSKRAQCLSGNQYRRARQKGF